MDVDCTNNNYATYRSDVYGLCFGEFSDKIQDTFLPIATTRFVYIHFMQLIIIFYT